MTMSSRFFRICNADLSSLFRLSGCLCCLERSFSMSDSTASIYDSKAPHLPGAGSQLLLGLYSLWFSRSCKEVWALSPKSELESFLEKCSFSLSLRKNALVSSLTALSFTSRGVGQTLRPLESSDVSDSVRDTLETFSTGQSLALEFYPSVVGNAFRTKRLERGALVFFRDTLVMLFVLLLDFKLTLSRTNFFSCVFCKFLVRASL